MTRKRHVTQRYTADPKPIRTLRLTGRCYLRYVDGEETVIETGDMAFYLSTERDGRLPAGHYDVTGYAGYFKAEVYDGKGWHLLALEDFFPDREHHFTKTERPMDTYRLCTERMQDFAGRTVAQTYREHYALVED